MWCPKLIVFGDPSLQKDKINAIILEIALLIEFKPPNRINVSRRTQGSAQIYNPVPAAQFVCFWDSRRDLEQAFDADKTRQRLKRNTVEFCHIPLSTAEHFL